MNQSAYREPNSEFQLELPGGLYHPADTDLLKRNHTGCVEQKTKIRVMAKHDLQNRNSSFRYQVIRLLAV